MAAEPDHLPAQRAAQMPCARCRTGLHSHSLPAQLFALLAPATALQLRVIRVHQHLLFLFLVTCVTGLLVIVRTRLDVVVERATGVGHEHVVQRCRTRFAIGSHLGPDPPLELGRGAFYDKAAVVE